MAIKRNYRYSVRLSKDEYYKYMQDQRNSGLCHADFLMELLKDRKLYKEIKRSIKYEDFYWRQEDKKI